MGVESSRYQLTIMATPDVAVALDKEYLLFQLRKQVPNAARHLGENGEPTGSAGSWDTLPEDMKPFSLKHPALLFRIDERYEYDGTYECRHFIENGKSARIEPVQTWPEFDVDMLS